MLKEYKGKKYLVIPANHVIPLASLRCHIFIFLPLNNRMLKVRDHTQSFDAVTLERYARKGHGEFFVLDPDSNPGSYDFSPDTPGPLNPALPGTMAEEAAKEKPAFGQGEDMEKEKRDFIQGEDLAKGPKKEFTTEELEARVRAGETLEETKARLLASPEAVVEESRHTKDQEEIDLGKRIRPDRKEPESESVVGASNDGGEAEVEQAFGADKAEVEAEQVFGAGKAVAGTGHGQTILGGANELAEKEQKFGSEPGVAETERKFTQGKGASASEQRFGGGAGASAEAKAYGKGAAAKEAQQSFGGEEKEEEVVKTFGAEKDRKAKEQILKKFAAEQKTKDEKEKITTFKAEEKKEAKRADVVTFKDAKKAEAPTSSWVNRLEEKQIPSSKIATTVEELEEEHAKISPEQKEFVDELKGTQASEVQDPESKVSQALHKHLGLLRGELNSSGSIAAVGIAQKTEYAARRNDLKEEIARCEATRELVESLDEHCLGGGALPRGLSTKSAPGIIQQLEQKLEQMKGKTALNEEEHAQLKGKIDALKSKHPELATAPVQRLGEEILGKIQDIQEKPEKGTPEALAKISESVQQEVKSAKASANVAKALTDLRKDLIQLLGEKPKNAEAEKIMLAKAAKIQGEIIRLEKLGVALDTRKIVNEEELAPFLDPSGSATLVGPDETPEVGLKRVAEELEDLQREVVARKREARDAETELKAKILGQPYLPSSMANVGSVSAMDHIKDQILEKRQELSASGKARDPAAVAEMQKRILQDMRSVQSVIRIENRIAGLQGALTELLQKERRGALDPLEMEAQALLFQKDIQELQSLREAVQSGKPVESSRFSDFASVAPLVPPEKLGPDGWNQMLASVQQVKKEAAQVSVQAAKAEAALAQGIDSSQCLELKKAAVNAKGLEQAEKAVSRHLKAFLETGKDPDPNEIWELNHSIAKEVEKAHVEMGISRSLSKLAEEQKQLLATVPEKATREQVAGRSAEIQREIKKLEKLGNAVRRGEHVSEIIIKPYIELIPDVFVFMRDKPIEEEATRIMGALEQLKEEVMTVKVGAIESLAPLKAEEKAKAEAEREQVRVFKGAKAMQSSESREEKVFAGAKTMRREDEEILIQGDGNKSGKGALKESIFSSSKDLRPEEELELEFKAEQEKMDDYLKVFKSEKKKEDQSVKVFKKEVVEKSGSMRVFQNEAVEKDGSLKIFQNEAVEKDGSMKIFQNESFSPQDGSMKIFESEQAEGPMDRVIQAGEKEKEVERTVKGTKEARELQSGVYAATLLRAFGYRNRGLEEDLVMACLLWDIPFEKLPPGIPERARAIHQACYGQGGEDEMVLRDLAQAARMAREYIDYPGVVTGAYSLNLDIFTNYCQESREKADEGLDPQLLERARQSVAFGIAGADRDHVVDLAYYIHQKIAPWKQSQGKQ